MDPMADTRNELDFQKSLRPSDPRKMPLYEAYLELCVKLNSPAK